MGGYAGGISLLLGCHLVVLVFQVVRSNYKPPFCVRSLPFLVNSFSPYFEYCYVNLSSVTHLVFGSSCVCILDFLG